MGQPPPKDPKKPSTQTRPATPNAPARTSTGAFLLPTDAETFQRQNLASTFGDDAGRRRVDALLGGGGRTQTSELRAVAPGPTLTFDGTRPAEGLSSKDTWRALTPPLTSTEGRRSPSLYANVLAQFAVGHNPRYEPDAPDKPRAHLFVWDVTRAMEAEIPHFAGPRELTLAQTCDWLRHEGPMRGWRRMELRAAQAAAAEGCPVVGIPRELRTKLLGLLRPEPGPDGLPRVSAAAKKRGHVLTVYEAFGTMGVEWFAHA